jgi:hypothetical protein
MFSKIKSLMLIAVFVTGIASVSPLHAGLKGLADKVKKPADTSSDSADKSDKKKGPSVDSGANPASVKVFEDNKDMLRESYEFFQKFTGTQDSDEMMSMAESASDYIKIADKTLANLKNGIKEGIEEFESKYADAKKFRLKSNIGYTETYLEKAKDKLGGVRKSYLKKIESNVDWLGMSEASAQVAPKAMEEINASYAALEKIWGKDSEVAAHKTKYTPIAQKRYDALMKKAESNTMPKSKYTGGDKAALEKAIAEAYKKRYPDEVVRVVITDPNWREKTEIADDNVKLSVVTYNYISAHVAVKKGTVATVFAMSFRKNKKGGALEIGGTGNSYPVMMSNINK